MVIFPRLFYIQWFVSDLNLFNCSLFFQKVLGIFSSIMVMGDQPKNKLSKIFIASMYNIRWVPCPFYARFSLTKNGWLKPLFCFIVWFLWTDSKRISPNYTEAGVVMKFLVQPLFRNRCFFGQNDVTQKTFWI